MPTSSKSLPVSEIIRDRLLNASASFNAGDNISDYIKEDEIPALIDEVTDKFQSVLTSLVIDTVNDPNSMDTPRRLAKMYINELMRGRYVPCPSVTSFPNIGSRAYHGMLVAKAEITSMCSHHHQTVQGLCYIGILPTDKVIGLSKYTRIAQWCARRGTLQEELTDQILAEIQKQTGSDNIGVHITATHNCMEARGLMAHDSSTSTTSLSGQFYNDSVKKEFFDNIMMQHRQK